MTRNYPGPLHQQDVEIVDLTSDDTPRPARRVKVEHGVQDLTNETEMLSIEDDVAQMPILQGPIDIADDEDDDADPSYRELTPREWADVMRARTTTGSFDHVRTPYGITVKVGMSVELNDGDFLFIVEITSHDVVGILLRRAWLVKDLLPKKLNEVCAILKSLPSFRDPSIDECLVIRPLKQIIAIRNVVFTNAPFSRFSFRDEDQYFPSKQYIEEQAVLVCRWKYIEFCDCKQKVVAETMTTLKESECTKGKALSSANLRRNWRGTSSHSNSSSRPSAESRDTIDLTDDGEHYDEVMTTITHQRRRVSGQGIVESSTTKTERIRRRARRLVRFIVGDICAGAGGVLRGAYDSGLRPQFALDHWEPACLTLKGNWPEMEVLHMDIFTFLTKHKGNYVVDVLHISYPCQPHSLAHTVDGKKDDENIATAYSVGMILEKCKPRIVTFEQTSGIIHKGGYHYRALINQIASAGYSMRSKIISCDAYGNSQPRKRLIIIAACPGETLPPFPTETHGEGLGLKRPPTVNDRLRVLRNYQVPHHMRAFRVLDGEPYDANFPLRRCITTDGGDSDIHPSGKRTFTLAELACLAGFPPGHRFHNSCKTDIMRQIGNAVPPCVAKALFDQIQVTMRETDRKLEAVETIEIND